MKEHGNASSLLAIGKVLKPHGVRGVIKMLPYSDDPTRLEKLERVYIGAEARPAEVVGYSGTCVLLKLGGVDSRDAAEGLRGLRVDARQDELPPLKDGEFYVHDLVGLDVVTPDGQLLGKLSEVISLPASDIYVVDVGGRRVMVPAVPQIVTAVDVQSGTIEVTPPPGLLDL
jgi:16S rRNA processing protein RimM